MTKFLSFDLEIAALIPDDTQDWKQYRPLGITCAAVAWAGDDGNIETNTTASVNMDGQYESRMPQSHCIELVFELMHYANDGYTLLTWNGLGFDWDILAEESGMHTECAELALNHVDPMFQMLCIRGFPVGLDAVAKGHGLPGKTEGMSGAKAPEMWAAGQYEQVLEYVRQDAKCTLEVALAIEGQGGLHWISKGGYRKWQRVPKLLTAREASQLPEPNVKWMSEPMPRSKFTAWMEAKQPE